MGQFRNQESRQLESKVAGWFTREVCTKNSSNRGYEDVTTTYETAFPEYRFNDEEPGDDKLFHRAEFWDRQELDVENRHFEIEYAVGTPSDDTLNESEQRVVIAYYPPADGSVRVFAPTGDADLSPTDCAALIFEPTICASFIDDEGRDWHINFYSDGYWEFNGRSDSTTGDAWAILERETASE